MPDASLVSSPASFRATHTTRCGDCGRAFRAARSFFACLNTNAALHPSVVHMISVSRSESSLNQGSGAGSREKPSEFSETCRSYAVENAAEEARRLLEMIAGTHGTVKERLYRAHRRCASSFTFNRVRDIYYGDKRMCLTLDEIVELRRIAAGFDGDEPSEVEELRERLDHLEALVRRILAQRERSNVA
jgi:hypothetical protein